jgi:uncharacterized protein YyaL (SSP411 family)
VEVPEVHRNQLGREPSDFLRSRSSDPIHWQPWSPALKEHARSEQKLIFALVGNARFPETTVLLDSLRKKPAVIEKLHEHYICSLVDPEVHPEIAIQVAMLSSEIRRRISFPAMMWLSHEGNPVAWLPLSSGDVGDIDDVFGNSETMVSRIWRDSSLYVVQNSRRDNDSRKERQRPVLAEASELDTLGSAVDGGLRRLSSLYDAGSASVDGGGGLVPGALWRLAGTAALSPRTDPKVAGRLTEMLEGNTDLLLRSAIRDPLDGGFFSARRSTGWEIPVFMKTVDTQSQMALGLARAGALLESPRHRDAAREVLEYASRNFGGPGGDFGSYEASLSKTMEALAYLWPQEALREFLTPEEFAVASAAYGISAMGNIPPESDPRRDFFRKNSLAAKLSATEVAEELGLDVSEVKPLMEAVRKRLLAQREEVVGRGTAVFVESCRITATNARHAAAAAEFAAVSGDSAWLQRARQTLEYLETRHRDGGGRLLRLPALDNRRSIKARSEDYAALMDAHLAVYRLDLDPAHLDVVLRLCDDLLAGHVNAEGFITEAPATERLGVLHTFSNRMIYGDSSWGALVGPLTRLHQLTGSTEIGEVVDLILRASLAPIVDSSPTNDLIHTDFLNNAQVRLADTVVFLAGEPDAPAFDALHAVLQNPKYWAVTVVHLAEALPSPVKRPGTAAGEAPSAHVITGQGAPQTATNPADLERLVQEALRRD